MGQGGKGGKPSGSSKRMGRGRNKGKLPLNAHYFAIGKGLKRKRPEKGGGSWECKVRGAEGLYPLFPQSCFPERPYAPLDESRTRGKTETTILSGT